MRRRKRRATSAGGMGPRRSVSGLPESSMAEGSRLGPKAGSTSRVPTASAVRVVVGRAGLGRWSVNGHRIERERILRGWTRQQLAQAAGVDEKTLRDMLTGRRQPTFGTAGAVATALGLTLAEIIVLPHRLEEEAQ